MSLKIEDAMVSYGAHGKITPQYFVIHETAGPGMTAKACKDWWMGGENDPTSYPVHYVIDWTDVGYHCVPDDQLAYHVGGGNEYTFGVELCHAINQDDFNKVWSNAVELAARVLNTYGWTTSNLMTHHQCSEKWGGSDHTDPDSYFADFGKNWQNFLDDVKSAMPTAGKLDSPGDFSGASGSSSGSGASVAEVSYFVANQFKTLQADAMSEMLLGERAIANDVTLWSSVQAAVAASMRACCSAPDGSFIAWYPDYWGLSGTKGMSHSQPAVELDDMELVNLTITQSDDEFYSHVFTAGVNINGASSPDKLLYTVGVVSVESNTAATIANAAVNDNERKKSSGDNTVENLTNVAVSDQVQAILKDMIYIPEGEEWKYSPKELYRRYGARPIVASKAAHLGSMSNVIEELTTDGDATTESASIDKNPKYILPFLCALYEFMDHWANQYKANLEMTFMPELFPGCRIKLKSFDISFYVQSVTHNVSYEGGFTTTAKCICPIGSLVSGMVNPGRG